MTGNITRRGRNSWRLKYEAAERDPSTGKRRTRFITVRGTKKQAQAELVRRLAELNAGIAVAPDKVTVGEYLRKWLDGRKAALSPKTAERYRQLVEFQILPHLGSIQLQRLRPQQIKDWQGKLLKSGGSKGAPLAPRTVGDARKVLRLCLSEAYALEAVARNVADAVPAPPVNAEEVRILSPEEVELLRERLQDHPLNPLTMFALGTGMRRGEVCAVTWGNLDLDTGKVTVEHSMEQTNAGVRIKAPKTKAGRRTLSLPASVVEVMREYRRHVLEERLGLGLGRLSPDDLVFTSVTGELLRPNSLTRYWGRVLEALHALRHTHASAAISSGLDVVSVSKRLGHGSSVVTLRVYAHLFRVNDEAAAAAIDTALFK